jgi:glyoxylase-like metal-dependent hydrolase (beta-lactamase superfamily II)
MRIKTFVVGPIQTDCYLVADEKERVAMIIDPDLRGEEEYGQVIKELKDSGLTLKYIVNTHGHADHIAGNAALKAETGALILAHERDKGLMAEPWPPAGAASQIFPACPFCGGDQPELIVQEDRKQALLQCGDCGFRFEFIASPAADRLLSDGDTINLSRIKFRVIHTPGHTKGGISLYIKEENAVFTGDTLFKGSIGRTDLPGGSYPDIMKSLEKLTGLPPETRVYPGHGEPTTIAEEIRDNPYLEKPGE